MQLLLGNSSFIRVAPAQVGITVQTSAGFTPVQVGRKCRSSRKLFGQAKLCGQDDEGRRTTADREVVEGDLVAFKNLDQVQYDQELTN